MLHTGKTAFHADFDNRHIAVQQQLLGFQDSLVLEIIHQRNSHGFAKDPADIGLVQKKIFFKILQSNLLRVMVINIY